MTKAIMYSKCFLKERSWQKKGFIRSRNFFISLIVWNNLADYLDQDKVQNNSRCFSVTFVNSGHRKAIS